MEVKINTDVLRTCKLSLDEYFYLYLKYNKIPVYDYTDLIFPITGNLTTLLEYKNLIKFDLEQKDYFLTNKALVIFEEKSIDKKFEEFWSIYPIKVPNGKGSYRAIKTKDIESKQALDCKKKYISLIKKPGEHEKIIKGLNIYLKSLRPTLQFCVGVEVFLNQQMWEKYLELDDVDILEEKIKSI